jgi:hypothetical protein
MTFELFPDLDFGRGPANGGCVAPVGRRRNRRPRLPRRPSPTAVLAAEVQRLATLLESLGPLLEGIKTELVVSTQAWRQTNELVERLARQHVELRRDLGPICTSQPGTPGAGHSVEETINSFGFSSRAERSTRSESTSPRPGLQAACIGADNDIRKPRR